MEPRGISSLGGTIDEHTFSHQLHALAEEVRHNLQYQHQWSALSIHSEGSNASTPLPRPLVSGIPPQRIYVHPDDQIAELKLGVMENKHASGREWVLPTRLKEKWSLRRFAEVFDAIEVVPPSSQEGASFNGMAARDNDSKTEELQHRHNTGEGLGSPLAEKKDVKRVLLAVAGDDSTIVYYIVHNGLVKPRQN